MAPVCKLKVKILTMHPIPTPWGKYMDSLQQVCLFEPSIETFRQIPKA